MTLNRRMLLASLAAGLPVLALRAPGVSAVPPTSPAPPVPGAQPAPATRSATPPVRYTMTAFTNDSEADLYVYESSDALHFEVLKERAYHPPTGLMRDPCMFRHTDGGYYLTYTTGWEGRTIGFAHSTDRINWSHMYDYEVGLPAITSTWAPEWLIASDGSVNVMVSLSNGYRFTPHIMTAADRFLRSWSDPTPMLGLTPEPGDDQSYGYIDTTVVPVGNRYYAFTKNETTKLVELAVGDAPAGPYSFVAKDDWAGWGTPREGQSLTLLPDGGRRIFFDAYEDEKYYYSDSYDGFTTWTPPRELPDLSGTVRHVTVYAEPNPRPRGA
ncbi:glycoside hydrolase [Nocardia jejuensis]|uniref:glycoside hydrolase n=1 Tax=Nocardia jejuensis TaxID=328049 RepID=UPI00082A00CF|nr:glycoside hydrolase [Nocardia jejuensis]